MKKITLDDLAWMVTKGFNETKTELREEIKGVENNLSAKIDGVENRLSAQIKDLDKRMSTAEFLLSNNRIEHLEDSMRQVKTILKIK